MGIIKRKIIEKYKSFSRIHDMVYRLKWLGVHKVRVRAWQEKEGATINNMEFVISMSKDLMRDCEYYFTNKSTKFDDWLYPTSKVHNSYIKRFHRRMDKR